MKLFYWTSAVVIGFSIYLVLSQAKNKYPDVAHVAAVRPLSKGQMEAIYSQLVLCEDNQIISEKDFKSLSKKKQKIVLAWLNANSKYQPRYTQSSN